MILYYSTDQKVTRIHGGISHMLLSRGSDNNRPVYGLQTRVNEKDSPGAKKEHISGQEKVII